MHARQARSKEETTLTVLNHKCSCTWLGVHVVSLMKFCGKNSLLVFNGHEVFCRVYTRLKSLSISLYR